MMRERRARLDPNQQSAVKVPVGHIWRNLPISQDVGSALLDWVSSALVWHLPDETLSEPSMEDVRTSYPEFDLHLVFQIN
jgi:hypothetical protein